MYIDRHNSELPIALLGKLHSAFRLEKVVMINGPVCRKGKSVPICCNVMFHSQWRLSFKSLPKLGFNEYFFSLNTNFCL